MSWSRYCGALVTGFVLAITARAEPADRGIRITQGKNGQMVRFVAEPGYCRDATITFEADLTNVIAEPALPVTVEIKDGRPMEIAVLRPAAPGPWNFRTRYHWLTGTRGGEPDGTVYQLPFERGHHGLGQGYRGKFSHQAGSNHEYALDWIMPVGTPIFAARGGVVVGVRQDSTIGGTEDVHKNAANYVVVRHSDGTYSEYLHLQAQGARVQLGETVTTGQFIGLSGNTGYSTAPHLHFAVFRTIDGQRRQTLPVRFQDRRGNAIILTQGNYY